MATCSRAGKPHKALVLTFLIVLTSAPAHSTELAYEHNEGGTILILRGQGVLTYALFFDVYRAGLYMPAGIPSDRILEDVAKRLEIHYNHKISARDIVIAAQEILARNWPPEVLAAEKDKLDRINRAYVDVGPGDRYALTHLPGRGTGLSLNGRPQGTIPGARFAALVFPIWLGKEPLDMDLRDALLGYD